MKNERSLYWNLVLYPKEDNTHYNALEYIKLKYNDYAYIIHNRDINDNGELKKEHVHVVIKFVNYRWRNALALELGITPNYLEKCISLENSLKYLIHYGDNNKYQYSIEDVQGNLKDRLIKILDNLDIPEGEKLKKIIFLINECKYYLSMSSLLLQLADTTLLPTYRKYAFSINQVLKDHNIYYTTYDNKD